MISILIWIVFYIHGLFSINNAKNTNKITNIMHARINKIASLVKEGHSLHDLIGEDINHNLLYIPVNLENILKFLESSFEQSPDFKSNKGLILKTYKTLENKKDNLLDMIRYYSSNRLSIYHNYTLYRKK